jgi:hypothetical protein
MCAICDVQCTMCLVWCVVCDVWCKVCSVWCVVFNEFQARDRELQQLRESEALESRGRSEGFDSNSISSTNSKSFSCRRLLNSCRSRVSSR